MSKKDKIKIGFIGVGRMGQCAHLRNYVNIDSCRVVAIAEPREVIARQVAHRYGIEKIYSSHLEMLKSEDLDGVVLTQPFGMHRVLVPDVLSAGVPLFTEKPLASSVEIGANLVKIGLERNVLYVVGYHKRSDPAVMYAIQEIRRFRQSGELGTMKYVRICVAPGDWVAGGFDGFICDKNYKPCSTMDPKPTYMSENEYSQYIEFINKYIHQINLMRFLLGESYTIKYVDPSSVLIVGLSENKIGCSIEISPYQTRYDWHESALVCFQFGYVKIELPAPMALNQSGKVEIFIGNDESRKIIPQLPAKHAMYQQAHNFIKAVQGEKTELCSASEALDDLKLSELYIVSRRK